MLGFTAFVRPRWVALIRRRTLGSVACAAVLGVMPAAAEDVAPIHLRVAGGLGGVTQYEQYEAPFWTREVPRLTNGRVEAEIAPFDRSGIRGADMLGLLRWLFLGSGVMNPGLDSVPGGGL
jgi:hypothetical protein